MKRDEVSLLAGREELLRTPMQPFSREAVGFLDALSRRIRKSKEAINYPDVMAFAFFIRRANLEKCRENYQDGRKRLGRGIAFHIAPSNVPVNFAFSYVFGLLAGNANIVRVSSKQFEQVGLLCRLMQELFEQEEWEAVAGRTQIISYPRKKEITDYYSSLCSARVIWGGDATIEEIRSSPLPGRAVEIAFADRYSLGMIAAEEIEGLADGELKRLAEDFYNDTYLMDQNACSAPHLILWLPVRGLDETNGRERLSNVKRRFWEAVFEAAGKYRPKPVQLSEKFGLLCETAAMNDSIDKISKWENLLYVVSLSGLKAPLDVYRGKFGLFFEADIEKPEDVYGLLDEKAQTLAVAGLDREALLESMIENQAQGIDRIVPFGKTLDIGLVWDGYDVVQMLSRIAALQ